MKHHLDPYLDRLLYTHLDRHPGAHFHQITNHLRAMFSLSLVTMRTMISGVGRDLIFHSGLSDFPRDMIVTLDPLTSRERIFARQG